MRIRNKIISFVMGIAFEDTGLFSLERLQGMIRSGEDVTADEIRYSGLAMASPLIEQRIRQGRIEKLLGEITAGLNPLGIEFKRVEGGSFVYQGEPAEIESFELAETPFTIGQMKKLLEFKGDEVRAIFQDEEWNIDKVIQESENTIEHYVPVEERDNCPLVFVSHIEAEALAELLGYKIPNERQWERAASGTTGLKRPWGDELSEDRAVYDNSGTRPVKSKLSGRSEEGIYDLIGQVWEWTSSWYDSDQSAKVLRGGSWGNSVADKLSADCRDYNHPEDRCFNVGLRFGRTL